MKVTPTGARERIHALDVLRGVAVFGILMVNVEQMFLPMFYANDPVAAIPGAMGTEASWFLTDALFENKFLTLFSVLFGVGFAIQFERSAVASGFMARYFRRLLGLAAFGLVHALFFYSADVLVIYALTALLVIPWRRAKARTLAIVASILLVATIAWGTLISGPDSPETPELQRAAVAEVARIRESGTLELPDLSLGMPRTIDVRTEAGWEVTEAGGVEVPAGSYHLPMPGDLAILILDGNQESIQALVEYAVFSTGPPEAARFARLSFLALLIIIYLPFFLGWRTLALFLIGVVVVKSGWLEGSSVARWRRTAILGLCLGVPMTLASSVIRLQHHSTQADWLYVGHALHDVSSLLLAGGIASTVLLWTAAGLRTMAQRCLAAVGRTALTNYIGQSEVMSVLATSYGLGLYGDLTRLQLLGLAVACFALQVWVSWLWLQRFRFGPLEWLWRCFTYWRVVPLSASRRGQAG